MSATLIRQVAEFLSTMAETGLSISVAKRHVQMAGEKGVCDAQLTALHQSGVYSDVLEATASGTIDKMDRTMLRHVLGLPPRGAEQASLIASLTVDTSQPSRPGDWTEENGWQATHRGLGTVTVSFRDGEMYVNGVQVIKRLSPEQDCGGAIGGNKLEKLRTSDTDHPDLPDALLDLILREQDKPAVAAWLAKYAYAGQWPCFWATVYIAPVGYRYVRYLDHNGGRWYWDHGWLGSAFNRDGPTLVLERPLGT